MGLPVPSQLFDTFTVAVTNAGVMFETLKTFGKNATVAELVGATTGLEKLKVAGSLGAALYTGAVIGSIAVASGRTLSCGSSISDLFVFQRRYNLHFESSQQFYIKHPEILNPSKISKVTYRAKSIASGMV
ncbi:hypothetical protein PBPRA0415 [Photobacterium profundum SS9]|uniref:Uncharacterized protein n=1 Tax=Photobacterium profundum (strain SS9) TaxID=298386 RepID=Q6LV28_PHOPR|nr:hypothetical protein PBPRA0415 [Photobacterium profundum SS9]